MLSLDIKSIYAPVAAAAAPASESEDADGEADRSVTASSSTSPSRPAPVEIIQLQMTPTETVEEDKERQAEDGNSTMNNDSRYHLYTAHHQAPQEGGQGPAATPWETVEQSPLSSQRRGRSTAVEAPPAAASTTTPRSSNGNNKSRHDKTKSEHRLALTTPADGKQGAATPRSSGYTTGPNRCQRSLYAEAAERAQRQEARAKEREALLKQARKDKCTFQPHINTVPAALPPAPTTSPHHPEVAAAPAHKDNNKDHHAPKNGMGGSTTSSKKSAPAGAPAPPPKKDHNEEVQACDRLYAEAVRRAAALQQERSKQQEETQQEEKENCTFAPTLAPRSKKLRPSYKNFNEFLGAQEARQLEYARRLSQAVDRAYQQRTGKATKKETEGAVTATTAAGENKTEPQGEKKKKKTRSTSAAATADHAHKGPIKGWKERFDAYMQQKKSATDMQPHPSEARKEKLRRTQSAPNTHGGRSGPQSTATTPRQGAHLQPLNPVFHRLYEESRDRAAIEQLLHKALEEKQQRELFHPNLRGTQKQRVRETSPRKKPQATASAVATPRVHEDEQGLHAVPCTTATAPKPTSGDTTPRGALLLSLDLSLENDGKGLNPPQQEQQQQRQTQKTKRLVENSAMSHDDECLITFASSSSTSPLASPIDVDNVFEELYAQRERFGPMARQRKAKEYKEARELQGCTFHPRINRKSLTILAERAESKEQEQLLEGEEDDEGAVAGPELGAGNNTKRRHEDRLQHRGRRSRSATGGADPDLNLSLHDDEQLSAPRPNSASWSTDRFFARQEVRNQRQRERSLSQRVKMFEDEMRSCTFRPQLSPRSERIMHKKNVDYQTLMNPINHRQDVNRPRKRHGSTGSNNSLTNTSVEEYDPVYSYRPRVVPLGQLAADDEAVDTSLFLSSDSGSPPQYPQRIRSLSNVLRREEAEGMHDGTAATKSLTPRRVTFADASSYVLQDSQVAHGAAEEADSAGATDATRARVPDKTYLKDMAKELQTVVADWNALITDE